MKNKKKITVTKNVCKQKKCFIITMYAFRKLIVIICKKIYI